MNLQEAYQEFDIPQGSTEKEIKKKYRELSAKYHPDISKEPGAEDKMKRINQAYDRINKGDDPEPQQGFNPFQGSPFADFFANNNKKQQIIQNIELNETISFKEAVFGTKRDLKFKRKVMCQDCSGQSKIQENNGCKDCNGTGTKTHRQQNMIFQQTCQKCQGKKTFKNCIKCSNGTLESETSINVNIPGGINSGNILRLGEMGNFAGIMFGGPHYSDAYLHLNVTKDDGLSLDEDGNVTSTIEISLLEAIKGCKKDVKTADGSSELTVNPLSKHNQTIILPNLGANRIKDQIVTLNVSYPDNILEILESK